MLNELTFFENQCRKLLAKNQPSTDISATADVAPEVAEERPQT